MLNNYGKPNIMTYDILQASTTVISGIISIHQALRIGDHTHNSATKLFPPPISSMFYYVHGATQKFREFEQGARTGCRVPFHR
jgi:hypothetical protein